MNRQYSGAWYSSSIVKDNTEGFIGYDLVRIKEGCQNRIARILYWDACGQFSVETLGSDVPLEILEALIAEAKSIPGTGSLP